MYKNKKCYLYNEIAGATSKVLPSEDKWLLRAKHLQQDSYITKTTVTTECRKKDCFKIMVGGYYPVVFKSQSMVFVLFASIYGHTRRTHLV